MNLLIKKNPNQLFLSYAINQTKFELEGYWINDFNTVFVMVGKPLGPEI